MEATKIIIVEDEPLFSEMLCRTLSGVPSIKVLETTDNGETAIRLAMERKPDVMLVDIELKGELDGIESALLIKKKDPQIGIVILSVHSDRRYITSLPLENCQGWAYLLKQTVPDIDTVRKAIEATKAGMIMLDPAIFRGLQPKKGSVVERLNPRLREVLSLVAEGHNNDSIAKILNVSPKTVENYMNAIYQELSISGEPNINMRVKAAMIYVQQ